MSKKLSIVIPVYNEENLIEALHKRVEGLIETLASRFGLSRDDLEILFINDGSTDATLARLTPLCEKNPYVLINLSRNYGHQLAITAGLDNAQGEAVVMIDGDLQDPPEFIADLYAKFQGGYDVVYAVRKTREGETWFKLATASLFYRLFKSVTRLDIPLNTGDFRIMSRRVVEALKSMRETDRFLRAMTTWVGFKQTGLEYDRQERLSGESKYTLWRMLKLSMDAITSYSAVPLKMVSILGFASALIGFLLGLWALYKRLFTADTVQGWTSIIIVVLFMGGSQLIATGVIGEYLKRVSDQSKQRPLYFIEGIKRGTKG